MKKIIYLLITLLAFAVGCKSKIMAHETSDERLKLLIDNLEVEVDWEQNDSVNQLIELAKKDKVVIEANRYGGFEQVGSLGRSIKSNDVNITTEPGDIVLYNDSSIVVFFGSNSWSYTKLGKIRNKNSNELKRILDKDKTTLTIICKVNNIKSGVNTSIDNEKRE